MPLQIFLNATLRQYVQGYDPYQGVSLEIPPGTRVGQVMAQLGLPAREVTLIMVDGRRQETDFSLQGNERLGLFPPIGGG
jgi:molybdopterin synthase sulfur carrier subunit